MILVMIVMIMIMIIIMMTRTKTTEHMISSNSSNSFIIAYNITIIVMKMIMKVTKK